MIFLFVIGSLFFATGIGRVETISAGQTPEEMSLDQAIRYALEYSPDLQSSAAEVRRREGVATTVRSGLLPQVDLFGDASHTYYDHAYPPATSPQVIRFNDRIYTAGAELKFLVWDFFQTAKELRAARERIRSAEGITERRKQEVLFNVANLYLKTLTYNDLADAAQSTRKSLGALLDQTRQLVEAGRAVPADVLKVSTRLAQVESDLATLESGRRTAISQLAAAMGFEGRLPRLVYIPSNVKNLSQPENEEELIREAIAHRQDLSSQMHETNAASEQETAARRSQWPRVEFRAGAYGYTSASPISSTGKKADDGAGDWAIGLRVTFPLFDAGKRRGQIQSAVAQRDLAQTSERKLRLDIEKEVRSALAEMESAQSRVRATRQSVAQAEEVLRNERLKYEAGRSVINFVLDAEAALLTNQSLLWQAERSVSIASLLLDLSLGRIGPAIAGLP
jgi:outer membrane protein TolC